MPTIHDTIILVTDLHREQRDQAGQPYILHVLRVMLAMHTEAERLVALLHDVVEDGHLTLDDLRAQGTMPRSSPRSTRSHGGATRARPTLPSSPGLDSTRWPRA